MADQEKDSNKEVQPVESGQGLSPFADLDRWFEDSVSYTHLTLPTKLSV